MSVQFPATTEFGNIQEILENLFSKTTRLRTIKCSNTVITAKSIPRQRFCGWILPSRQQMSICSIRDCFRLIGFSFWISQNNDVAMSAANNKMSSQKTDFARRKHLLSLVPRDAVTRLSSACKHRISGTQSHVSTTCTQALCLLIKNEAVSVCGKFIGVVTEMLKIWCKMFFGKMSSAKMSRIEKKILSKMAFDCQEMFFFLNF